MTVAISAEYVYMRRVQRRRKESDLAAGAFWLRFARYGWLGRQIPFYRDLTDSQIIYMGLSSSLGFVVLGALFSAFLWVTYLVISLAE